jgi:predicted transposase YdaD
LLDLIEAIVVYKFPRKTREEIEAMFNLSDLKQTRVYQEALAEGQEQGIQQGIQQGIGRGIVIGKQQGEAELILRLLNRRLGGLSPSLGESIRSLSIEQLENLAEALLDFNSEEDLRIWLRDNS